MRIRVVHTDGAVTELDNIERVYFLKKEETITEFADRCKECGSRYGKLLKDLATERTGHWIANAPQYDMLNPQYICSKCGNAHTRTTPYCEMCGVKMVESQESEDKK